MKKILIILFLSLIPILLAQAASKKLSIDIINNSWFYVEQNEQVKLIDGIYSRGKGPLDDNFLNVKIGKIAFGELNNDNNGDAVAILIINSGGSGSAIILAVLLNKNGKAEHVASVDLGMNSDVTLLEVKSGVINIELLALGPNDPQCCPTIKKAAKYKLSGTSLMNIN